MVDALQLYSKLRTDPECSTSSLHHAVQADFRFLLLPAQMGRMEKRNIEPLYSCGTLLSFFKTPDLVDPVFQRPVGVTKKSYLSTARDKVFFNDETKCLKFF